jgi:allose kinase
VPISEVFTRFGQTGHIKKFIEAMSVPAATEINILDPDAAVLGGGVLEMSGFPLQELDDQIRMRLRKPLASSGIRIIFSENQQQAGVLGASYFALGKIGRRAFPGALG